MTEQKTYEHEGVKLIKEKHTKNNPCDGCFFEHKKCTQFVLNIASCFPSEDGNELEVIFIEAKEELVNKIES